jgi:hypothetical protein
MAGLEEALQFDFRLIVFYVRSSACIGHTARSLVWVSGTAIYLRRISFISMPCWYLKLQMVLLYFLSISCLE